MVARTERHRELVRNFETHRARLGKPDVVRVRGSPTAHQTRLLSHEREMLFAAQAPVLRCRQGGRVRLLNDPLASSSASACRSPEDACPGLQRVDDRVQRVAVIGRRLGAEQA